MHTARISVKLPRARQFRYDWCPSPDGAWSGQCRVITWLKELGLRDLLFNIKSVASASLGLVSPGAARGVTTIFSWKKLATFFGHHCHFYWFHSGVTPSPWKVSPAHTFYLSDLVCPLLFVNLATIFRKYQDIFQPCYSAAAIVACAFVHNDLDLTFENLFSSDEYLWQVSLKQAFVHQVKKYRVTRNRPRC